MPYRLAQHQHTAPTATVTVSPLHGSRRAVVRVLRRAAAKRPEGGRTVPQGAQA